ncbi:MAG: hypothetical protein EOP05_04035 [Proteobacteria bacterium]|nr:MAG: hypothetical protein EOP05_04035 [Pseudomonadota bacterium]
MRRTPLFIILSFAGLLVLTMQNCGKFTSGGTIVTIGTDGDTSARDTRLSNEAPLLCSNLTPDNPNKISVDEQVQAAGRISLDYSRWGFVTKAGRVYMGFADGNVTERDAGTLYKWFDFAVPSPCGITLAGVVRCEGLFGSGFRDVPALSGSIQVHAEFPSKACGLQPGGFSIKCVDAAGVVTTATAPEEIILMSEHAFYAKGGNQYWLNENSEFYPSPLLENHFLNRKEIPTSSSTHVTMCNLTFATSGFSGTSLYGESRGCAITEGGKLYCIGSKPSGPEQRELVSVNENGDFSRQLNAISPNQQFLAVTQFSGGSLACAIRRDLEVVCFSTAFAARRSSFEELFAASPIVKSAFLIPQPETIVDALVGDAKACVLKSGVVSCWRNPIAEYGTANINLPYNLMSSNPITSLVGFINQRDATYGLYSRACMLDSLGALLCEPSTLQNSSRTLVQQDPGIQWVSILFEKTQPSRSCGLTRSGELRCTKDYSGDYRDYVFETKGSGVAFMSGETLMMNDGRFGGSYRLEANILRAATSIRFASTIAGHPNLFRGTDGKVYGAVSSDSWGEISGSAFASVENLLSVGGLHYFDRTNKRCPYLATNGGPVNDRACSIDLYTDKILNADVAYASMSNGIYLKTDGSFYSRSASSSSNLYFIPPTVMTPR